MNANDQDLVAALQRARRLGRPFDERECDAVLAIIARLDAPSEVPPAPAFPAELMEAAREHGNRVARTMFGCAKGMGRAVDEGEIREALALAYIAGARAILATAPATERK